MSTDLKTTVGRLREACVSKIHELRAAYDAEGKPQTPKMTYHAIAIALNVSPGTVYNVATGRTHRDDVPLGHPMHPLTPKPAAPARA